MQTILNYMKACGEQLDADIAAGTKIPLNDVRLSLSELSERGEIILCRSTRFIKGQKSEGMLYRIAGVYPEREPRTETQSVNARDQMSDIKNGCYESPEVFLTSSSSA